MNKIKERRKNNAVCPSCKSPDYEYLGRVFESWGKHEFVCKSCGERWHYGKHESIYTKLK